VWGWVQDTAFRRIAGVHIAIVGTTLSTVAGADGSYELTGNIASPTMVRVAKEGYVTETRAASWLPDPARALMLFTLEARSQPVDVSGEYTVTLTADNACPNLPSEARSRTYTASIVPTSLARTRYSVTVQGGSLVIVYSDTFEAGVAGDFLNVLFEALPADYPALMEQIAPNTYVAFRGTATAAVTPAPSVISAAFDGRIDYCALKSPLGTDDIEACGYPGSRLEPTPSQPVTYARCESKNHRLTFTRR